MIIVEKEEKKRRKKKNTFEQERILNEKAQNSEALTSLKTIHARHLYVVCVCACVQAHTLFSWLLKTGSHSVPLASLTIGQGGLRLRVILLPQASKLRLPTKATTSGKKILNMFLKVYLRRRGSFVVWLLFAFLPALRKQNFLNA